MDFRVPGTNLCDLGPVFWLLSALVYLYTSGCPIFLLLSSWGIIVLNCLVCVQTSFWFNWPENAPPR